MAYMMFNYIHTYQGYLVVQLVPINRKSVTLCVLSTNSYPETQVFETLPKEDPGPISLRLLGSEFKDIVTHTQKYNGVKCMFCGVWVQNFVWNFEVDLWNFTQNFESIRHKKSKMHILRCVCSKFCVKFLSCSLKIHTKCWIHTPRNMHFMRYNIL